MPRRKQATDKIIGDWGLEFALAHKGFHSQRFCGVHLAQRC
ncbi:hypothetical protein N4P55_10515 [Pseudomonas fluorescens]|nr:hypothetical protein [Pseudomonas fluorescens]UXV21759.1 hypothetical protein N4P55_10515 [Pseudomonas fluorescens]